MRIIIIGSFFIIYGCIGLNAQQLRKWTNTEGRSFSGTIVDCDGETAKMENYMDKMFLTKALFQKEAIILANKGVAIQDGILYTEKEQTEHMDIRVSP